MALLNRRPKQTRYANPITAHHHRLGFAVLIQIGAMHCFGIARAKLKHMPYLNAAANFNTAFAIRRRITGNGITNIGNLRQGQITLPVHTGQMESSGISTADKITHIGYGAISDDDDIGANTNRTQGAWARIACSSNFCFTSKTGFGQARNFAELDFI